MFTKNTDEIELKKAIADQLETLRGQTIGSGDYLENLALIERLHKLLPEKSARKPVSPDAVIAVVGNLLGIYSILGYERVNVITSKALGFVTKTK
jgi:hypothetical protein